MEREYARVVNFCIAERIIKGIGVGMILAKICNECLVCARRKSHGSMSGTLSTGGMTLNVVCACVPHHMASTGRGNRGFE